MISPQIDPPLRAIRRRLRAQAAFEGAAWMAIPAASSAAIAIYLYRAGHLSHRGLVIALAGGLGLVVCGALARTLRRIPLSRPAFFADRSHRLHDRLGSALAFLDEPSPTPFMQAAIRDAEEAAPRIEPRRAAPFSRPRALGPAAAIATLALLVALIHFPRPVERAAVVPPPPRRFSVDPDLTAVEREAVEGLLEQARAADDQTTETAAKELKKLLDDLDQKALTRTEVFDKLAQIEKQFPIPNDDAETIKQALKKAGDELSKHPISRDTGEALEKENLAQAKAELEKLAARAERLAAEQRKGERPLDDRQRKELANALSQAAQAQAQRSAAETQAQAAIDRLKSEQRRLQRELAERPNDQNLKRQLQRNQRELQRLEREKQARAERERQLQRLQRELQRAAEELQKQLSPEAAEALRKLAQQMNQIQDELRKLGDLSKTKIEIASLKEMLRRAGTSSQGQPQPGQSQASSQSGGKGQKGAKSLLRDFNQRAGGKSDSLLLGQGNTPVLLPLPSGDGNQPNPSGPGQGQPRPQQNGDGIGDQHDPNLLGDPTELAARHQETRLTGKEGAGPSRSETILGSAERGFATRSYKKVYDDYSSVVEEVMSKERVPPGYRYYIKRYFQLIRPRQ